MKMIGIEAVTGSALSRRATSNPSMPGITASSRTTSGCARAARSSAVTPSSATSTV